MRFGNSGRYFGGTKVTGLNALIGAAFHVMAKRAAGNAMYLAQTRSYSSTFSPLLVCSKVTSCGTNSP
jgi:hypothetical protein